jgi:hypothetical protein
LTHNKVRCLSCGKIFENLLELTDEGFVFSPPALFTKQGAFKILSGSLVSSWPEHNSFQHARPSWIIHKGAEVLGRVF